METTFIDKDYDPKDVAMRFVRLEPNGDYQWVEMKHGSIYTIREGYAHPDEIPEEIRTKADSCSKLNKYNTSFVKWPL